MEIAIENFKCHANFKESFAPLTVLCGRNGSGKSSVIQAMLLHHLACSSLSNGRLEHGVRVPLNGPFSLNLGMGTHLVSSSANARNSSECSVAVGDSAITLHLGDGSDEQNDFLWARAVRSAAVQEPKSGRVLPSFVFLSAERLGPRLVQPQRVGHRISEVGVGACGENSAEVFRMVQRGLVDPNILNLHEEFNENSGSVVPRVGKHLEFWLGQLFEPIEVRVEDNSEVAPPSLQFRSGSITSDWLYPPHYGFGVTYALPILLAGLASEAGDVLIVDSPEAHLHPAAQTQMARFLSMLAAAGRQVIVETHSDHIIDGFRLAVATREWKEHFPPELCTILFFQRAQETASKVSKIHIHPDGALSEWPQGFFDQMTVNLRRLSDERKRRSKGLDDRRMP